MRIVQIRVFVLMSFIAQLLKSESGWTTRQRNPTGAAPADSTIDTCPEHASVGMTENTQYVSCVPAPLRPSMIKNDMLKVEQAADRSGNNATSLVLVHSSSAVSPHPLWYLSSWSLTVCSPRFRNTAGLTESAQSKCMDAHSQSVSLPAQDLDLQIFVRRMMIANRCDTSPARRKIFMMFLFGFKKLEKRNTRTKLLTGLTRLQETARSSESQN